MVDIVTSTLQTFMENKTQKTTTKPNSDSISNASLEATTQNTATDMITNAGGDLTLLTYRGVVCENIQKQSEQLSALLEAQSRERSIWL